MIQEDILKALQMEYQSGKTQCELAKTHGVTQTYIQCLLSGKRKPEGITLGTLQKMFPRARLDLKGGGGPVQVMQNCGDGNRQTAGDAGNAGEEMKQRAVEAVLGMEGIPDDVRTKVLRELMKL